MLSVQILQKSTGKPLYYKRVQISFDGINRGVSKEVHTDRDGWARFDNESGKGEIFVDGKTQYRGVIEGVTYIYI